MNPEITTAIQVIRNAALSTDTLSAAEADEVAFHLTDWLDDLKSFVDLLEHPSGRKDDEVLGIIIKLLVHAPYHITKAAKILVEEEPEDDPTTIVPPRGEE